MSSAQWSTLLTAPQRAAFLESLDAVLEARGLGGVVEEDILVLGDVGVALSGLAEDCAVAPLVQYPAIISTRIDDVLGSAAETALSEELDGDWAAAKSRIKLRIFTDDEAEENAGVFVSADIGADLTAVLVYDLPQTIASVQPAAATGWGVPGSVLWQAALDNLRAEPPPTITRIELTEAAVAIRVTGDSFFIPSRLLILGDILPAETFPYGALVTVPHRHTMIIHPITGPQVFDALVAMRLMAVDERAEGPGPLSDGVYWWVEHTIERIALRIDDAAGEVTVQPSASFAEVLEWLRGTEE